jgi:cysteine synthase
MIAASKGYGFLCVTDPRCNLQTRLLMEALGAEVHVVTEVADPARGLLGARMDHVRARCAADPRYVWLNQYENQHNWQAHHRQTAPAIDRQFPQLDVLFVGAGTTGTLMGCARWFREHRPSVRIVAVDPAGSVSFGGPASPRMIPGLGMAVRPPLLDESYVDEVVVEEEVDTVRACHRLARRGFLFGGSTGTVVSGATKWLARHRGERRARAHRGHHRPGPGRAVPRHRVPAQLGGGRLRRGPTGFSRARRGPRARVTAADPRTAGPRARRGGVGGGLSTTRSRAGSSTAPGPGPARQTMRMRSRRNPRPLFSILTTSTRPTIAVEADVRAAVGLQVQADDVDDPDLLDVGRQAGRSPSGSGRGSRRPPHAAASAPRCAGPRRSRR